MKIDENRIKNIFETQFRRNYPRKEDFEKAIKETIETGEQVEQIVKILDFLKVVMVSFNCFFEIFVHQKRDLCKIVKDSIASTTARDPFPFFGTKNRNGSLNSP